MRTRARRRGHRGDRPGDPGGAALPGQQLPMIRTDAESLGTTVEDAVPGFMKCRPVRFPFSYQQAGKLVKFAHEDVWSLNPKLAPRS